jgi:hypothetical protein
MGISLLRRNCIQLDWTYVPVTYINVLITDSACMPNLGITSGEWPDTCESLLSTKSWLLEALVRLNPATSPAPSPSAGVLVDASLLPPRACPDHLAGSVSFFLSQ